MSELNEDPYAAFRAFIGEKLFAVLEIAAEEKLGEILVETETVLDKLALQSARQEQARRLLDDLVPTMIDTKLWRDLALGDNVHLPASDQYGPLADRLKSQSARVEGTARNRGSAYGRVHDKGSQEPSAFLRRQGDTVRNHVRRIVELEDQVQREKERLAEAENGMKFYALAMLLTELRNATAPVFAMGPAWTLLRAIAGSTGKEIVEGDRKRQTHGIMVILHALRDDEEFRQEIKIALLNVCDRYTGAAAARGKADREWGGPHDYDIVLSQLGWPPFDEDK